MKIFVKIISLLSLSLLSCTSQENKREFFRNETDRNYSRVDYKPAPAKGRAEQIIERKAYTLSYNKDWVNCNWVYWKLTREHCNGNNQRDNEKFVEDNQVNGRKANHQDYVQSGYDRGHMCPAGDNKWDKTAISETFKMSNICPQNHNLNTGDWNDLEQACRFWAKTYGEVYIVCGPIYNNGVKKRINNKVGVPDAFFKCVVRLSDKPFGLGFIYNNTGKHYDMETYVCSIDDVERRTGLDFFKGMPNEASIEARASLSDWRHYDPDYNKNRDRNKFDNEKSGGKNKKKNKNKKNKKNKNDQYYYGY